jgi:hypothetical protein
MPGKYWRMSEESVVILVHMACRTVMCLEWVVLLDGTTPNSPKKSNRRRIVHAEGGREPTARTRMSAAGSLLLYEGCDRSSPVTFVAFGTRSNHYWLLCCDWT